MNEIVNPDLKEWKAVEKEGVNKIIPVPKSGGMNKTNCLMRVFLLHNISYNLWSTLQAIILIMLLKI